MPAAHPLARPARDGDAAGTPAGRRRHGPHGSGAPTRSPGRDGAAPGPAALRDPGSTRRGRQRPRAPSLSPSRRSRLSAAWAPRPRGRVSGRQSRVKAAGPARGDRKGWARGSGEGRRGDRGLPVVPTRAGHPGAARRVLSRQRHRVGCAPPAALLLLRAASRSGGCGAGPALREPAGGGPALATSGSGKPRRGLPAPPAPAAAQLRAAPRPHAPPPRDTARALEAQGPRGTRPGWAAAPRAAGTGFPALGLRFPRRAKPPRPWLREAAARPGPRQGPRRAPRASRRVGARGATPRGKRRPLPTPRGTRTPRRPLRSKARDLACAREPGRALRAHLGRRRPGPALPREWSALAPPGATRGPPCRRPARD